MKKRILIICPFVRPNIGGVETHIEKLTKFLITKNCYPIILTYQPITTKTKGLKFEKHQNYEIHRKSWFGYSLFNKFEKYFPLQFLYLFPGLFLFSLKYFLKNYQTIDCIHAHGLIAATITSILDFIHPTNTVVSTHAVYDFTHRRLLSSIIIKVLSTFNQILAVSEISKDELISIGIPSNKLNVHPNWIDTNYFRPKFSSKTNLSFGDR